jgi:hypothetical protein
MLFILGANSMTGILIIIGSIRIGAVTAGGFTDQFDFDWNGDDTRFYLDIYIIAEFFINRFRRNSF